MDRSCKKRKFWLSIKEKIPHNEGGQALEQATEILKHWLAISWVTWFSIEAASNIKVNSDLSESLDQMTSNIGRLEILKVYKHQNTKVFQQVSY